MNFTDFEAHVRTAVEDAIVDHVDTNATWSTGEIARYYNDAIVDYSQYFPRQRTVNVTIVAGTQAYDLPGDILQPPDTAIKYARWRRPGYERDYMTQISWPPGSIESIWTCGAGMAFYIWGGQFILADSPSATNATYEIELWYHACHELCIPVAGDALYNFRGTIPDADQGLLFWYVTAVMMGKLEASDADLRRWADRQDGGSARDDNPPRKSSAWRMDKYQDGIAQRLGKSRSPRLVRQR